MTTIVQPCVDAYNVHSCKESPCCQQSAVLPWLAIIDLFSMVLLEASRSRSYAPLIKVGRVSVSRARWDFALVCLTRLAQLYREGPVQVARHLGQGFKLSSIPQMDRSNILSCYYRPTLGVLGVIKIFTVISTILGMACRWGVNYGYTVTQLAEPTSRRIYQLERKA